MARAPAARPSHAPVIQLFLAPKTSVFLRAKASAPCSSAFLLPAYSEHFLVARSARVWFLDGVRLHSPLPPPGLALSLPNCGWNWLRMCPCSSWLYPLILEAESTTCSQLLGLCSSTNRNEYRDPIVKYSLMVILCGQEVSRCLNRNAAEPRLCTADRVLVYPASSLEFDPQHYIEQVRYYIPVIPGSGEPEVPGHP